MARSGGTRTDVYRSSNPLFHLASLLIVDGTADAGVYVLTIDLEFSGSGEKPITREEQISLAVKVLPQLLFNILPPRADGDRG